MYEPCVETCSPGLPSPACRPGKDAPADRFCLRAPRGAEWDAIARLAAESIPNYLVSQLGTRFGARYYRHLASHPGSCCIAAYAADGSLAGFILGTVDRQAARRLTLPDVAGLLLAANLRLLSPACVGWLTRGIRSALRARRIRRQFPPAELVVFAVTAAFRGEGLAPRLVESLEAFFRRQHLRRPYLILTEKANTAANRFYGKCGARLVRTYKHHGREINEWHKPLA